MLSERVTRELPSTINMYLDRYNGSSRDLRVDIRHMSIRTTGEKTPTEISLFAGDLPVHLTVSVTEDEQRCFDLRVGFTHCRFVGELLNMRQDPDYAFGFKMQVDEEIVVVVWCLFGGQTGCERTL